MNQIDENEFYEEDVEAEFVEDDFKIFQEQVRRSINTPTNDDRLQDYESLVPHIVDSPNEVSSRIAGFDQQLTQIQKNIQRDLRQEILELKQQSLLNQQNASRQISQLQQHLQQSLGMQQLILTNLQFLTNQRIESIVSTSPTAATSNSSSFASFSAPVPDLPSSSVPSSSVPSSSTSTSFTSIASSSRALLPTPAQPENTVSDNSSSSTRTRRKYKKKEKATKWVNYNL
ncbi:hypothetical protein BD408DRAFT_462792 [Parasitella parasitica]|nr:hypothetical protein BD408DRAFT_462792 [Parasitella parasitica]